MLLQILLIDLSAYPNLKSVLDNQLLLIALSSLEDYYEYVPTHRLFGFTDICFYASHLFAGFIEGYRLDLSGVAIAC